MKIKLILNFLFLVLLVNVTNVMSQDTNQINKKITSIVEETMHPFLEKIPDANLKSYGIKEKNEIEKATLGDPVPVYTISDDTIAQTNTWRVPLVIDKEYRALFTVFKSGDEEYKIVEFGAVQLAKEFSEKRKDVDFDGLLRVYKLRRDFFICSSKGIFEFHPIPTSGKTAYTLEDIKSLIK